MSEFRERENFCLRTFEMNGPYWHLFTSGKETPQIFKKKEDFGFAMNVIAQTALKYNEIKILTFELMGNHLHILAEGPKEQVLASFSFIRKRLGRGLKDSFPDSLPKGFAPSLKEVTSLDAMRNTIVYINRNGFVADANHTPYTHIVIRGVQEVISSVFCTPTVRHLKTRLQSNASTCSMAEFRTFPMIGPWQRRAI